MKYHLLLIILFLVSTVSNVFGQDSLYVPKTLAESWEIGSDSHSRDQLFRISEYKKLYVLFANYTTDLNKQPTSDNPKNVAPEPIPYTDTELTFQLSFKTKALRNILGEKIGGDVWVAYTQSSRWQVYNEELSRPFRETNYEPEAILLFNTPYKLGDLQGIFAGVGFNHQSNGRSRPLSRSWNRVIFQAGMQLNDLQIIIRPWFRIQESTEDDDNPDIENYLGRTELTLNYPWRRHYFTLNARHSLRGGSRNHGSARLDYSFRFYGNLKLHAQIFTGYGESMIDYNHKQTTFGFGISLN